jgi:hypothetical protein
MPQLAARFQASPRACAGPKAAAAEDEGFGLPGELVRAQPTVVLLPDPRHAASGKLSAHVQLDMPGSPHVFMLHMQAVRMESLQAAEQPADLAPVRFNC